ncbi:cutinase-domain-containing protein [Xylariaceae sp. FL0804]|nr:cutinase-domain-containing protein [Xylariaceae sp. FL0804]
MGQWRGRGFFAVLTFCCASSTSYPEGPSCTMKSIVVLSFFLALAAANPVPKRQTGDVANEFVDGGCRDNVLIFSRGTSEPGNMGVIAGPPTANGLKAALGDDAVAAQGVDYAAGVGTNFLAGGADPAGISTMTNLVNKAATECPSSNLLVVGYRYVRNLDAAAFIIALSLLR